MNSNRSRKANSIDPKWKHLIDIFSSQSPPSADHYGLFTPQNPQNNSDLSGFQSMFIRKAGKASTLPFKHYPTHSYSGHLKVDTHFTRFDTFGSDTDTQSAQHKKSEVRTATTANSKSTRAHTLRSSKKEPESATLKKEIRPRTSGAKTTAQLNRNNTISSYFQLETETIREGESLESEDYDVSVASPLEPVNKSVSQGDLARRFLTLNLSSTKDKKDVISRTNNKSGGVSYKAINLTQQPAQKDLKLSLDEEDYKRFLNQTADKEGSLDGTASPQQGHVKVYSRNKDTAFHFSKMKPTSAKSNSTFMNSYGLVPQTSKFFNSSINDSSQIQGITFNSRPGTAVHRRSRNSKFQTTKIEGGGPNTTIEISQTKHKRPMTALHFGSQAPHIHQRLQTTSISPFLKIGDESQEQNKTLEGNILSHRSRGASPGLNIIQQETLNSHRSSRKSKVPGESEQASATKVSTEGSAKLSVVKRAKAAVTKHLKMLDLVKNLEIRERLSPKSIDQTSLMNKGTKYNQRVTDFMTVETEQVQDEVQHILDNISLRLLAGKNIHSSKPDVILEDEENRLDQADVDENGIKNKRKILNDYDIKIITEEYDKIYNGIEKCNYERVDALVNGLKFFSQLDKIMRLDLLQNGTLKHFPAGSTIFRQGDYGDLMYVILKGAVNVRIMKPTIWGTIEDVILAVLYDGAHFGEYSMMGTSQQNKRNEFKNNKRLDIGANLINVETGENNLIGSRKGLKALAEENKALSGMRDQESEASPSQAEKSPNSQNPSNYKERSKRAATIQVVESCDLLCIPRSHFQKIFLKFLQKDLDAKIQILLCLPFFSKMDAYTLIPIANNLTQKIYKLGDVIVNRGQNLDRFQIVSQGRCRTLLELSKKVETKTTVFTRGTPAAHRMFTVGQVDYTCKETATRDERFVSKEKKKKTASDFHSIKSFDQEKLGTEGDAEIRREHETLKVLTRGDYFAGRALLSSEDINVYKDELNKLSMVSKPAQVSIVADSAMVEVFELHKENFKFIPDFLAQILLTGLKNNKEFDEYDIPSEINQAQKWHTFKNKEVYDILAKRTLDKPAYYKKF